MKTYKTYIDYESSSTIFKGTVALVSYRNIAENYNSRATAFPNLFQKAQKTFSPSLTNVSINTFDTDFRSGVFESIITKNHHNFDIGHFNSDPEILFMGSVDKTWSKTVVCSIVVITVVIVGFVVASIVWATEWIKLF